MRHLLALVPLLLLVACRPTADMESATMLTLKLCSEGPFATDVYPIRITVRTDQGVTKDEKMMHQADESCSFLLPTWTRYQFILRTPSDRFASFEYALRDEPATFVLMLSEASLNPFWPDTIHISFDDTSATDSLPHVFPVPCTLYQNHIVAFVDTLAPDSALVTLISLYEWSNLASAYHESRSDEARSIALCYQEQNLTGWHIPTADEAKRLRTTYGDDTEMFAHLNNLIASIGAHPLTSQNGDSNVRYLCEDAQKTFSFVSGSSITKAGAKVTAYHLRLLCTLPVRI